MTQPSHFLGTIGIRNTPGAPYTEADSGKEEDVKTPIGTSSYLESLTGPVLAWMEVKDFAALNAVPKRLCELFLVRKGTSSTMRGKSYAIRIF